ncbi:MAG: cadherin-like beta sandwich domain-containing protein [Erysipelotrichaceae bacterium]|nr:cadherin-like beta sandwich domain-containing protein [Erysipelotrichaceae bacterium]
MKKILMKFLILSVLLSFVSVNIETVKAASYQTRINGSTNGSLNIYAGNTFTVTFSMTDASNVYGVEANLNYSSTYFELVKATNEFSGGDPLSVGSKVVVSTTSPKSGTFNFAKLTFKAKPAFLATTSPQAISLSNVFATYDKTKEAAGVGSRITVDVVVPKSSNNNLASLSVNGTSVTGFSATDTSYTLANTDATSITIAASASDSKASVSGTGTKSLAYGVNKFNIVVTAESGAKKTYTVTITRNDFRSTNNDLKSLTVEGYTVVFDKDKLTYTVIVDNAVTTVNVGAQAADDKASVTGTGAKTLKIYSNLINIVVTAENTSKKTYVINVVRRDAAGIAGDLSRDNKLKSLVIADYPFEFNPDTLEYTIDVENWIETVNVTVELSDSKASYLIANAEELIVGPNEILVKVYSESAEERIYKVTVNRMGDNPVVAIERIIALLPRIVAENIEITTKDPTSMTTEIWNQLVGTDKNYMFSVRNEFNETLYMWKFEGLMISQNEVMNFDVQFDSLERDEIRRLLDYRESILLNLAHSGEIPEGLTLSVNVSKMYKDDSILYLYYYDSESGKLVDEAVEFVVKEGYVEVDLDHASQYVLTPVKLSMFDNLGLILAGVVALLVLLLLIVLVSSSLKVKTLKRRLARKTESAA